MAATGTNGVATDVGNGVATDVPGAGGGGGSVTFGTPIGLATGAAAAGASSSAARADHQHNRYAVTAASITIPSQGSNTASTLVDDSSDFAVGDVFIISDGTYTATMSVASKADSTHAVFTAYGAVGDSAAASVIASGATIKRARHLVSAVILAPNANITIPSGNIDVFVDCQPVASTAYTVSLPATVYVGQTFVVKAASDSASNNNAIALNSKTYNGTSTAPAALSGGRPAGVDAQQWACTVRTSGTTGDVV